MEFRAEAKATKPGRREAGRGLRVPKRTPHPERPVAWEPADCEPGPSRVQGERLRERHGANDHRPDAVASTPDRDRIFGPFDFTFASCFQKWRQLPSRMAGRRMVLCLETRKST